MSAERRQDETAWVIEYGNPPCYWDGRGLETFSYKHEDALRFSRQDDADRARVWLLEQPDNYIGRRPNTDKDLRTVQHVWVGDTGRATPAAPELDDYRTACEALPDSLGRPLAARIQLLIDNLRRESKIGCELRRELDGGIERDARAIEARWPEAAQYLRSHDHIEDGV